MDFARKRDLRVTNKADDLGVGGGYNTHDGSKLPESKRDRWFNKLENFIFDDPPSNEHIPERYKSSELYRNT